MNNIWLHRIKHHAEVSHRLLEQGYLTIGFSDFATPDFVVEVKEGGWDGMEDAIASEWGEDHRHTRVRYNLWRFTQEMKAGDWVVVPIWEYFSIYEIVGTEPQLIGELDASNVSDWHNNPVAMYDGLLYREDGELIDLGFFWRVKPVRTGLSRYDYADAALTSRMKFQGTNVAIPEEMRSSIQKAITAFDNERPINLRSEIADAMTANVLTLLNNNLNPDKFERLVKWYFERVGATSAFIPAKNESGKEGDADVIATFEPVKTIFYAQVKFHTGETSDWAVQQINAYQKSKAEKDLTDEYTQVAWVVSLGFTYSEEAINLAKEQKIQLINGEQFTTMLLEAGLAGIDEAIAKS